MVARVEIHELTESDLEDVFRFRRREVGADDGPEATLAGVEASRWYLFDNPESGPDLPKGFVARDESGSVVGTKICAPQRFRCGDEEFVLLLGGGYYVNRTYRGVGLRLMREYLATGDRVSHFSSTMNEASGAIYERYGGYPVQDTEHEMIGVLRWPPFIEEVLARRLGRSALVRIAAATTRVVPGRVSRRASGELRELHGADELDDLELSTPPEHQNQITAVRDPRYLRWRYFEGPDRSRSVFEYQDSSGARGLVTTRLRPRGGRGQLRTLTVLDYFGALPAEAIADVARLLARRFRGEADMIVFRGQPPERQQQLRRAGFMNRPLARAIGVCIDRAGRLPTREWYMVPADGDMST